MARNVYYPAQPVEVLLLSTHPVRGIFGVPYRVVELQKFRRSQEEICHEHGRRDVTDDRYENEIGRFLL